MSALLAAEPRLRRDLHPAAWWAWAIGLATAASFTTNPYSLLLLLGASGLVVAARRGDQPWAASYRLYLWLGLFIVLTRVIFRLLLGGAYPGTVILDLPSIPLPDAAAGIVLLGPVTREALLAGLYDGLRLATIVVCIGAANALGNPKRLLRSVPPALYEIGTALVVAVTVFPQFAESVRRVRAAQTLRAGSERRLGRTRRFLVPVLEDALDHSLALAAGMDTRGYGRSGDRTPSERRRTGTLMIAGLLGICVGVYATLDATAPRVLAAPMWILGVLLAIAGLISAGRSVNVTRYRPDPWRTAETVALLGGLGAAVLAWWVSRHQITIAYPDPAATPTVSVAVLAGTALAVLGGLLAPAPEVRS
ncbi:CbiQ family ECF transporter T component [Nocardioides fonticola]|uniref:CbiQ family ECF transporter T component n=1 Tax=Nocardioides fonticola TaxID=450363 RepID=A0ABP7XBK5_9ACTN